MGFYSLNEDLRPRWASFVSTAATCVNRTVAFGTAAELHDKVPLRFTLCCQGEDSQASTAIAKTASVVRPRSGI